MSLEKRACLEEFTILQKSPPMEGNPWYGNGQKGMRISKKIPKGNFLSGFDFSLKQIDYQPGF
jgi:hypothetical protein